MSAGGSEEHRGRWDSAFRECSGGAARSGELWLRRWLETLENARGGRILDLGCGDGRDSRFLTRRGFSVVAADFSGEALGLARRNAPGAEVRRVDMTRGLPFPDAAFRVIVASLSLHYFPWGETLEIVKEVRRCLGPGGCLLARFNSTNDEHYDRAEKERLEENFYLVGGMPKRLFDRRSINALFADGWELESARERVTEQYGRTKTLWEVAVRKPGG